MTTPVTPRDLFREFSAMEKEAEGFKRLTYSIAVDLVDGMLKGRSTAEWADIYTHIRNAAQSNLTRSTGDTGEAEQVQAWEEIIEVMDIALQTL